MNLLILCLMLAGIPTIRSQETCNSHATDQCMAPGTKWKPGICNAVYGGYMGNAHNLKLLASHHFQNSFKFLVMASYFNTAESNRMGFHKLLQGYSDKMWDNGKGLLKYILQRGGAISADFKIPELKLTNYKGEVWALASTLDDMKKISYDVMKAYRHASNKHSTPNIQDQKNYDPSIAHVLEEKFMNDYSKDIRDLAGKLNILGRMTRDEKTKAMGLHLFDQSLL